MEISESDQLRAMEKEIASAADFIVHLIRTQRNLPLNPGQVMLFRSSLMDALRKKFLHHWFVDEPTRGSAFRCLQIHKCMDPVLMDAAAASGLNLHALRQILPRQFFMWIDPGEVSYRFGENGSICVLYDARMIPARNDNQASDTSEENVRLQDENVSNNNPASFSKRDEGELQPDQLAQDGLVVESPEILDAMIGVGDPSLVSSRKLSLRGCKWRYRGEGNANLVIALPQQKEVMRLHKAEPRPKVACDGVQEANKCPSEAELAAEAMERDRVRREVLFCRRVMVPLVGACYLRPPVVAKLDSAEVEQINYILQSQRPAHRHHKEVLCAGGHMTLHPDYALLPANLADPDPTVATYCVEVKPKQGWIPHHNRFLSKCTYCTKQFLKLKNQSIAVRSSYCPLDLFSGNNSRMKEALQALLENPQNNLKIFKNGVLVYGDDLGGYDSLFEILLSWFGTSNKSLDKLGLLNCFYEVVIEALTRDLSDGTLMHLSVSRTQYNKTSDIISKDVQKLRNVAAPILQPPCDQTWQELPTDCVLDRILNLQLLEQSQNDSEVTSPCPKKDYGYVGAVICDPGTFKTPLHRYLLAATAKDCSILLAFQQVNNERSHSLPRCHIARQAGNGQLYVFNVGVSDLDPKPASCIEKHKQRDQEILLACAELASYNREIV